MTTARVEVEPVPDDESTASILAGLRAFNDRYVERSEPAQFNIVLRDHADTVVGGCVCEVKWHWLFVDLLWVSDDFRGAGHGTALLRAAEHEARRRGCTRAHLDTISFQARPFYESLGWRHFGTLEDYPPGHTRFYLQKDLIPTD
ncbi:MAG TPA: GNAT family N-acetyltransferase [Gemmatimonadaceae bacterium]|nr:GNAT family N-acetyltransferase [Gemmatimonadaceae bacterium]